MKPPPSVVRVAVQVRGVVQGVGFRPFVHRVATARGLGGWVRNDPDGVHIEATGPRERVESFVAALRAEAPRASVIESIAVRELSDSTEPDAAPFRIEESDRAARPRPVLPADLSPCEACLAELADPDDRRYRYPFTNCTDCGPRYTIVRELPYDRERTTMQRFPLCEACGREYVDPADRRYHAEPVACPRCGPRLSATAPNGVVLARGDDALRFVAQALFEGQILALKGVGGYQLLVNAESEAAVSRLRSRKHRPHKPFAVMFRSLDDLARHADLSDEEAQALTSPAAPIVLVRPRSAQPDGPHARSLRGSDARLLAPSVAPAGAWLGAMLPSSPLHALLMAEVNVPLVCTSGNLSEEPICTEDDEARARLGGIADMILCHDRPIARPVDDSVARVGPTGVEVLRRARGWAPRSLPRAVPGPVILGLGAHLKATVALALEHEIVVSQHLGDLESPQSRALLERTVEDLLRFFDARPEVIACDLHPDYASTRLGERLAGELGARLERVQHHHAHVAACVAEHLIEGPLLGFAWDGTGLGTDGTIWGGEVFAGDAAEELRRVGHLRPFSLPGGDRAARDPRRPLLALLHEARLPLDAARALFAKPELTVIEGILERGEAPRTTSAGRLFDAVAALLGFGAPCSFEAQAAMALEAALGDREADRGYPFVLDGGVLDWAPTLAELLSDRARGVAAEVCAARFHEALAQMIVALARAVAAPQVVLSGGCFQNLWLARRARRLLSGEGFEVFSPRQVPTNDGGIALGQVHVAALRCARGQGQAPQD